MQSINVESLSFSVVISIEFSGFFAMQMAEATMRMSIADARVYTTL